MFLVALIWNLNLETPFNQNLNLYLQFSKSKISFDDYN
jgi:hypothetical protein